MDTAGTLLTDPTNMVCGGGCWFLAWRNPGSLAVAPVPTCPHVSLSYVYNHVIILWGLVGSTVAPVARHARSHPKPRWPVWPRCPAHPAMLVAALAPTTARDHHLCMHACVFCMYRQIRARRRKEWIASPSATTASGPLTMRRCLFGGAPSFPTRVAHASHMALPPPPLALPAPR